MKLIDLSIKDFIEEVDSKKPAPGGGSVSALVSLLGLSLTRMVGHLTISKKSFEKLPLEIQGEFQKHMDAFLSEKNALLDLIDADTEAFNQMMLAYKMPKNNANEINLRNNAIELATIHGIEVPLQVVNNSLSVLMNIAFFITYGNSSALSDVGVGAMLLSSGLEGAILNMKINLPGISNEEKKRYYKNIIDASMKDKEEIISRVMNIIHQRLDA